MTVIDIAPEHHDEIRAIHAAGGLDYRLPDLESPLLMALQIGNSFFQNFGIVFQKPQNAITYVAEQPPNALAA